MAYMDSARLALANDLKKKRASPPMLAVLEQELVPDVARRD